MSKLILFYLLNLSFGSIHVLNLQNLTTYSTSTPLIHFQSTTPCRILILSDNTNTFHSSLSFKTYTWQDHRPGLHTLEIRAVCTNTVFNSIFYYTILRTTDTDQSEWGLPSFSWQKSNKSPNKCTSSHHNRRILLNLPSFRPLNTFVPISIRVIEILPSGTFQTIQYPVDVVLEIQCSKAFIQHLSPSIELQYGLGTTIIDGKHFDVAPDCTVVGRFVDHERCYGDLDELNQDQKTITTLSIKKSKSFVIQLSKTMTSVDTIPKKSIVHVSASGLLIDILSNKMNEIVHFQGPVVVLIPFNANIEIVRGTLIIGDQDKDKDKDIDKEMNVESNNTRTSIVTSMESDQLWGGFIVRGTNSSLHLSHVHVLQGGGIRIIDNNPYNNKMETNQTEISTTTTSRNEEHCANVPILFDISDGGTLILRHSTITGRAGLYNPRAIVANYAKYILLSHTILTHYSIGINSKNTKKLIIHYSLLSNFQQGHQQQQQNDTNEPNEENGKDENNVVKEDENDHDGLYIVGGYTSINHTIISKSTDDCIDSGK